MKNLFNIMDNKNDDNKFVSAQNARLDIVGELEAIVQYLNHYYQTTDSRARVTIMDIVREEEVHVGQLFGLLFYLDPQAKVKFEEGYNEFMGTEG